MDAITGNILDPPARFKPLPYDIKRPLVGSVPSLHQGLRVNFETFPSRKKWHGVKCDFESFHGGGGSSKK